MSLTAPAQTYFVDTSITCSEITSLSTKYFRSDYTIKQSILLNEFPRAKNVQWSVAENYHKAIFTLDGLPAKVFYSPDGIFSYSVTVYPDHKLPEEILRNIYRTYKNHRIVNSKKFTLKDSTFFYIILENTKSYKILKITENDLEMIKNLRKSLENRYESRLDLTDQ